ncbi:aldo/keto reductase [Caproiciproducens faecalis]|uniref:Aldo/keto reductase n=1 Tax=Caproiciproducens faecalis TaxID=2820301 RepID=A0ABS7DLP9_9FIRM|nr:aldo/keto reductase [Caproiciproducens faecalis]MBW7572239.1 aldo/keto reductase [Caproiciproducens faecalis]
MLYKKYRDTDLSVSALGLGCMRLPKAGPDTEDIDYEKAQEIVDYALSHGINYIDTAHMYHGGKSEEFVGHALKKYDRSSYFLATKMPVWMAETPADVERIFNLQLERLQTDYFDFYLIHSVTKKHFERCKEFGAYEFLLQKKKEGVIRHLGFSFHDTPEFLEELCSSYEFDFAQIQLNYLDWDIQRAKEQYKVLERHHLPCIVMEPVRGGALANPCDTANKLFQKARPDKSIASWAIRFAASLPNVMTVLSGMSTMDQIRDNVDTMTGFEPLTELDAEIVRQAAEACKQKDTILCTGCRYCMDCPSGVDIPKIFKIYNQYQTLKDMDTFKANYLETAESERPNHCVACGKCARHCPQSIAIPEKLAMISALAARIL